MPTVYPSRVTPRGEIKPLKPKQEKALDLLEENAYQWTLTRPRNQAHDRVCHLQAEYESLAPLDRMDLHGLELKAQIDGIFRAASERGWVSAD